MQGTYQNLTEKQREALEAAYAVGYYDVPKTGQLADIARELDLTQQAVSERLRRGISAMLAEDALVTTEAEADA